MSSAVAMNRRVSRENTGSALPSDTANSKKVGVTTMPVVKGTAVQQCWQILNFHETRLNRVERYLAVSTQKGKSLDGNEGPSNSDVVLFELARKLERLEQENVAFRRYISAQQKRDKKSVSLEVTEDSK